MWHSLSFEQDLQDIDRLGELLSSTVNDDRHLLSNHGRHSFSVDDGMRSTHLVDDTETNETRTIDPRTIVSLSSRQGQSHTRSTNKTFILSQRLRSKQHREHSTKETARDSIGWHHRILLSTHSQSSWWKRQSVSVQSPVDVDDDEEISFDRRRSFLFLSVETDQRSFPVVIIDQREERETSERGIRFPTPNANGNTRNEQCSEHINWIEIQRTTSIKQSTDFVKINTTCSDDLHFFLCFRWLSSDDLHQSFRTSSQVRYLFFLFLTTVSTSLFFSVLFATLRRRIPELKWSIFFLLRRIIWVFLRRVSVLGSLLSRRRWRFGRSSITLSIRVCPVRCRKNWKLPDNWECSSACSLSLGCPISFSFSLLPGVRIAFQIRSIPHRFGSAIWIPPSIRWSIRCVMYIFVGPFARRSTFNMPRPNCRTSLPFVNCRRSIRSINDDNSLSLSFSFYSHTICLKRNKETKKNERLH